MVPFTALRNEWISVFTTEEDSLKKTTDICPKTS